MAENNIIARMSEQRGRESRCQSLATRFTRAEERELAQAARQDGKTLREWSREVLLREARRSKDDALFTETIATRMLLVNLLRPLLLREAVTTETISDIMAGVRQQKHETAREVMKQYAPKGEEEKR